MNNKKINIYDLQANIFIEIGRAIKLGLINLWRNKTLSLATIFVIAIMLCIFNSILAVNFISQKALISLNEKVDIVIYLTNDISFYDAKSLTEELSQLKGVKKAEYLSKEDALKVMSETYPETANFFLKFNLSNPLPPSIRITATNAEDHEAILNYIENSRYKNYLQKNHADDKKDQNHILSSVAENLIHINRFVKQLIFWVVLTFIIGGTLVIVNAISLTVFTRKNEIYIMRLVGATPNFIRLPFIIEGVTYGVTAVILSFIMIFIVGKMTHLENIENIATLEGLDFFKIFFTELGLSIILGIISSYSSVQKHLKGKLSLN